MFDITMSFSDTDMKFNIDIPINNKASSFFYFRTCFMLLKLKDIQ